MTIFLWSHNNKKRITASVTLLKIKEIIMKNTQQQKRISLLLCFYIYNINIGNFNDAIDICIIAISQ